MVSRLQINLRRSRIPASSTYGKTSDSLRTPYTPATPASPFSPYSPYSPATPRSATGFVKKSDRELRGTSTFLDMNPGPDDMLDHNPKVMSSTFLSLGNLGEDVVDIDWAANVDAPLPANDNDLDPGFESVTAPRAGSRGWTRATPRTITYQDERDRIELSDVSSPISPVSPWDRPLPMPTPTFGRF